MVELLFNSVHLVCRAKVGERGYIGVKPVAHPSGIAFYSEKWDFKPEDARSLLGGLIFLHVKKASPAHTGGLVYGFKKVEADDVSRTRRIRFYFLALADAKYARWQGNDHMRAWSSNFHTKSIVWERNVPVKERHLGAKCLRLSDVSPSYITKLQAKALWMP